MTEKLIHASTIHAAADRNNITVIFYISDINQKRPLFWCVGNYLQMGRCGICLKKWTRIFQHRTRELLSGYFHIWKSQSHWKSIFAFHIFHFIKLFRRFESNCPGIFWDFQRNTKKKQHDGVYIMLHVSSPIRMFI